MTQFVRSYRTLAFIFALVASMLPWPGLTRSAVAGEVPVGGDTSLAGSWGPFTAPAAFHALADVNGDGRADLIYTIPVTQPYQAQTNVYVQYSNGTTLGAPVVVATDSSATLTACDDYNGCIATAQALVSAVGDVNGDGRPDILFADGTVALGNGSGFGPKTAWGGDTSLAGPWYARPAFHALADVNGDGRADLIYTIPVTQPYQAQSNVYVQYSNGTHFGAPVAVATDSSATFTVCDDYNGCIATAQALVSAVGDVNGDGRPDILFADGTVALGNGSGFSGKTAWGGDTSLTGPWRARPAFHALADVDGDGRADLIYTIPVTQPEQAQTNVYVQYSNGTRFGAPVMVATDSSATFTVCDDYECWPTAQALVNAVGDVNGDGQEDILFANGSVATISIPFTLFPTYMIGSVDYVPPGAGSTVGYSTGTVTGTTVTTETTWSTEHTEKVGIASLNASVTFGDTFGGTNTHQVDMSTTINSGVTFSGAPADLINHDYDRINVFLGVRVNASMDYLHKVTTTIDFSHVAPNFSENGYNIWVGCLNGHFASSDCGVLDDLNRAGATAADYPAILCADPFADPSCPPPDPARYVFLLSRGYSKSQGTQPFSELNSTTVTNSTKTTYTHSVSAEASSPPGADIPMTVTGKLTWTYSSTTSNKTGSTSQSQFNILPPIVDNGSYTLQVYMDTIWKTFMFKLVQ